MHEVLQLHNLLHLSAHPPMFPTQNAKSLQQLRLSYSQLCAATIPIIIQSDHLLLHEDNEPAAVGKVISDPP